ncbi:MULTISPECIES: trigger factor [unclassified Corynebacterium]|uniref:trigger factor n=1 Tax=unclassified Corynebacterium TaxID=2624378 RepID=UPI0021AA8982|nr:MULTISPECIES: trigger factor [unclassified Corynebacterium]MCT1452707.1 trigger factor [Corynebacterium sp. p3-SID1145]MCT1461609.1 trigger factor [Corynebacterium sp. p3-SID1140]MDN8594606.1 trigger factor [Corynebacterium sp. P4_F2]WKK55551.1 trigger factor [Corynebacterium sp. P4-C1]WKK62961.1 trigger factor [Corynebacterium sp. P8-C1]
MKTSVDKLSDTRAKLTVTVPFDELGPEIDQAYKAIAQQVNIPGFRRGKAPRQLIDARFGRGPILEQVVNDMLPTRYEAAVTENDLKVIGQPEIDITKIEDNDVVEFTAEVDVRPEITVPDFSKISVEVPALKIDDEAVDEELDNLRARFGELKDTRRKMKKGDFAVIDIEASIDGEKIEEASTEGISYEIGRDDLIEGLDKAIKGLKTGEEAEFTSEIQFGEHKGEEATIKATVVQTKERKLPELDEEFVQMASEFDTVEELRESTRSQLEENKKAQQAADIRDEVLKAALEQTEFELPAAVVDEQVHNQLHQILGQMAHDEAAFAQMLEAQGTTREEFDKESREQAEESVRTQLFLDAVADQEEPEVSQQELTDHILFTAQSYGMDPNQFIMQLQQSGQVANLFADVRRGKALAAAISRTSVKDDEGNTIDPDDYFGEIDDEEIAEAEAADKEVAEQAETEQKADEADK